MVIDLAIIDLLVIVLLVIDLLVIDMLVIDLLVIHLTDITADRGLNNKVKTTINGLLEIFTVFLKVRTTVLQRDMSSGISACVTL